MPDCPPGSYNDRLGIWNETQCRRCPAGLFCQHSGMNFSTGVCFPGYWCAEGALDGYGNPGPLGGSGGMCPRGYYCPEGTRSETEFPCPEGTYQPEAGQVNETACF
eukprot:gene37601-61289_t